MQLSWAPRPSGADILIQMAYSSQHLKMHKVDSKGCLFLFFVQLRRQQFAVAARWVIAHLLTWKSVDKIARETAWLWWCLLQQCH